MNTAFKSQEGRAAVLAQYDRLMERLSVPHARIEVETRCGRTSLIAAGDPHSPPLVLLHGSSMNAAMWIGDLPMYASRFRVYAPDIPGEPGYSDARQQPLPGDAYANWLLDLLDALGIGRAALCGASLGGFLALKFAIAHPDRVERLALLCPAGIGSVNAAFAEAAMRLLPRGEAGLTELIRQIGGGCDVPEVIVDYQKLIFFHFNARREPILPFTDDELLRLSMPGIVFVGSDDIMLRSDETAARVRALLPRFEVCELPGQGHSLARQGPDILAFLLRG